MSVLRWHDGMADGAGPIPVREVSARQTSPTAGTIFEGTRKPMRLWFQAMWYVTNQKHGISALGVQRILGLGSYQTAWAGSISCGAPWYDRGAISWIETLRSTKLMWVAGKSVSQGDKQTRSRSW